MEEYDKNRVLCGLRTTSKELYILSHARVTAPEKHNPLMTILMAKFSPSQIKGNPVTCMFMCSKYRLGNMIEIRIEAKKAQKKEGSVFSLSLKNRKKDFLHVILAKISKWRRWMAVARWAISGKWPQGQEGEVYKYLVDPCV